VLLDVGGQDASEAFEDVGHSDEARETLEKFYVGDLKRKVSFVNSEFCDLNSDDPPTISNVSAFRYTDGRYFSPATPCLRPPPLPSPPLPTQAAPAWVLFCTPLSSSAPLARTSVTTTCRASKPSRRITITNYFSRSIKSVLAEKLESNTGGLLQTRGPYQIIWLI
jgi:hypothetical protein